MLYEVPVGVYTSSNSKYIGAWEGGGLCRKYSYVRTSRRSPNEGNWDEPWETGTTSEDNWDKPRRMKEPGSAGEMGGIRAVKP